MTSLFRRYALSMSLVGASCALTSMSAFAQDVALEQAPAASEPAEKKELTVGSKAPSIDVEHWLQEGDDKLEPIKGFESGKVYVVEFWATWCPPCIASMPHLAELQKQYKDNQVRIISISDEDLDTVKQFLAKSVPAETEESQTFGELTNAYSLTTDPDQSVYNDYMVAAGQNGIPTAFVVGKTGEIEWIGHPMQLDPVLEDVVEGDWDREAFKAELAKQKEDEKILSRASTLMRAGKPAEAASLVRERLATAEDAMMGLQMSSILLQIGQSAEIPAENYETIVSTLSGVVAKTPEDLQPYIYEFQSRANEKLGKWDEAISSLQEAIKRSEGPDKERRTDYLNDLKDKKKEAEEGSDEDKKEESDK